MPCGVVRPSSTGLGWSGCPGPRRIVGSSELSPDLRRHNRGEYAGKAKAWIMRCKGRVAGTYDWSSRHGKPARSSHSDTHSRATVHDSKLRQLLARAVGSHA